MHIFCIKWNTYFSHLLSLAGSRGNSSGCGDKSPSSAPVGVREEGSTAEAKSANTSSSSSPVAGPSREVKEGSPLLRIL